MRGSHRRPGDRVRVGDVLYELRADNASRIPAAAETAASAVRIGRSAPVPVPLVIDRVSAQVSTRGARVSGRSATGRATKRGRA